MSNNGLYRTGLVFAVLTAIDWVLFVIGLLTQPPLGDIGDVESYLKAANSTEIRDNE